jgi:hypothetical protein
MTAATAVRARRQASRAWKSGPEACANAQSRALRRVS